MAWFPRWYLKYWENLTVKSKSSEINENGTGLGTFLVFRRKIIFYKFKKRGCERTISFASESLS